MKISTRIWSGIARLKSGASGAKWPTSSGLVAVFAAISGIGHGHLFTPPPHSAGSALTRRDLPCAHSCALQHRPQLRIAAAPRSQNIDEMNSPKW